MIFTVMSIAASKLDPEPGPDSPPAGAVPKSMNRFLFF